MDNKKKYRAGMAAALGAWSIFGFSFMFSRIILNHIGIESMLMLRFLIAFGIILLLSLTVSQKESAPAWLRVNLKSKSLLPLVALGLLQPIAYFICEANGVALTNSSFSGMFLATIPVCAMFFGYIFLKERVTALQILFALVSIAGLALLTVGQSSGGTAKLTGVLCLLGAVLAGTLYNILSRHVSANYTAMECTLVMMGMGAAFFTLSAIIRGADLSGAAQLPVILSLIYLGIISSIAAFLLLNYANSVLPVAKSTAFGNLSTVLSLFAGVIFLHEPLSGTGLIGSALIITGIIGVQKSGEKAKTEAE